MVFVDLGKLGSVPSWPFLGEVLPLSYEGKQLFSATWRSSQASLWPWVPSHSVGFCPVGRLLMSKVSFFFFNLKRATYPNKEQQETTSGWGQDNLIFVITFILSLNLFLSLALPLSFPLLVFIRTLVSTQAPSPFWRFPNFSSFCLHFSSDSLSGTSSAHLANSIFCRATALSQVHVSLSQ